ncbi:MAG: transcription antitermination factor NusB [Clostridia bacterium]|nr:transcription antitermination factor NusB [Clostridia bacterium]MEE1125525.1 transcription antitermination factor NusB [Acutalibacteraceae bacterium]
MKSKLSRRQAREQAFLLAFERNFKIETVQELIEIAVESRDFEVDDFVIELLETIEANEEAINAMIAENSNGRQLRRISKVALSVLQLAISELKFTDISKTNAENPVSVIINEAILLAKKYSSPEEASFINGVLGSIVRQSNENE